MNENALGTIIKAALDTGFASLSEVVTPLTVLPNTKIRHQPTSQGLPTPPTIYWTAVSDEFFGFLKRTDSYDAVNEVMVHTEEQPVITTIQFNCTLIQDPANPNQLTAKDYLNYAKSILQSDVTRLALAAENVQVLRVKTGRQVYWTDDKRRMEADPSFDLEFAHTDVITTSTPSTTTLAPINNAGLYPV
jgi:hypothetical protein